MPPHAVGRPADDTGDPISEPIPFPARKKRTPSKDLSQLAIELLDQIDQQMDDARVTSSAIVGEVAKSNRATVRELQGMRSDIKTQFRILASSAFSVVLLLIIALLYVISLLASSNGTDPRIAAEAILTVSPALQPKAVAAPPAPARDVLDAIPTP